MTKRAAITAHHPGGLLFVVMFCALLLPVTAWAGPGDGSIIGLTKVVDNGPDSARLNLVIMAEGFTASEQGKFDSLVQVLVDDLFSYSPFDSLGTALNLTRINIASTESGADDPAACGGTGVYVATYFDASFCNYGIRRALVANNTTAYSVLNTWTPNWDGAIVLVNSMVWGGTGGSVAVFSIAGNWTGMAIHELGHSIFGLADEYNYWAGCGVDTDRDIHPASEPSSPNVTIQTVRSLIKWNALIEPATPIPTTSNLDCSQCDGQPDPMSSGTVGLYEGAHYYHCAAYRPEWNCMMRSISPRFCAVCQAQVIAVLTPYWEPPVTCECPFQGDLDANALIDAIDLGGLIDVVFFSASDVQDSDCPATRADFNNDDLADAVDLAAMIDHLFFSGSAPADPCAP